VVQNSLDPFAAGVGRRRHRWDGCGPVPRRAIATDALPRASVPEPRVYESRRTPQCASCWPVSGTLDAWTSDHTRIRTPLRRSIARLRSTVRDLDVGPAFAGSTERGGDGHRNHGRRGDRNRFCWTRIALGPGSHHAVVQDPERIANAYKFSRSAYLSQESPSALSSEVQPRFYRLLYTPTDEADLTESMITTRTLRCASPGTCGTMTEP
jgi:hypothetical protein